MTMTVSAAGADDDEDDDEDAYHRSSDDDVACTGAKLSIMLRKISYIAASWVAVHFID